MHDLMKGHAEAELTELLLDLDLPKTRDAQKEVVGEIIAGLERCRRQLVGSLHQPQECVGIEQQPHLPVPTQNESGRGASKSSLIQSCPA